GCMFAWLRRSLVYLVLFFSHPPPPALCPLSLHDALPICQRLPTTGWDTSYATAVNALRALLLHRGRECGRGLLRPLVCDERNPADRKSTRLNSSHEWISYAVFCLKKKKKTTRQLRTIVPT